MSIFDEGKNLEQDAERLAREHPEQVNRGVSEAEQFAERETGGRFDNQIQDAGQHAQEFLEGQQSDGSATDTTTQGG